MNTDYYTYVYLDPTTSGKYYYNSMDMCFLHEPFYIGKGRGYRCTNGIWGKSGYTADTHKGHKLKKLINNGEFPIIIKIHENLSNEMACILEKKLIMIIGRSDKRLGPLTNHTNGGDGTSNRNCSVNVTRQVYQYDLSNNFIKEYDTIMEAGAATNTIAQNISACCRGTYRTAGGFIWKYKNQEMLYKNRKSRKHSSDTLLKMKTSAKKGKDSHLSKINNAGARRDKRPVNQYTLDGDFVKYCESMQAVQDSRTFGTARCSSQISRCCNGKLKKTKGFIWKWV